jgi:hypothetical protein
MLHYFHCRTIQGSLPVIPSSHVQSLHGNLMTLTNGIVLELVNYRVSDSFEFDPSLV